MDGHELLMTAVRGLAVYVLVLAVIRVLGKRTVGNFTAFDKLTTEDLRRYGEKIAGGPGTVREVRGETDWMADDRASATVHCRSRTGEWQLRFGLRRDGGLWRITELEPPR